VDRRPALEVGDHLADDRLGVAEEHQGVVGETELVAATG